MCSFRRAAHFRRMTIEAPMKSIWTSFNLVKITRWLIRFGACHVPANVSRRQSMSTLDVPKIRHHWHL